MGKKYTPEDCWEIWVGLGDNRSFERVAQITGKTVKTIYNYSSQGKWKDRLEGLSEANKSVVAAFMADSELKKIYTDYEISRLIDSRVTEVIVDFLPTLSPDNAHQLKKLLETRNLNLGKATNITREEVVTVSTEALTPEELDSLGELAIAKLFGDTAQA